MNRKWTLNQQVYRQKKLLGHGKGGYSYLVSDSEGYLFVLKQIHHEPCSYYQFGDKMESELTSYSKLINADIMVPRLIAFDREEEIVLKEYVPGETIDHLVANGPLDPGILRQIKDMAKKAVDHGFNLDYYPTNFIFYEGYSTISITNATITKTNGLSMLGENSTGAKPQNFFRRSITAKIGGYRLCRSGHRGPNRLYFHGRNKPSTLSWAKRD
jgi:TP53 regulating kinase-like protein